jgi:hypothetical protein
MDNDDSLLPGRHAGVRHHLPAGRRAPRPRRQVHRRHMLIGNKSDLGGVRAITSDEAAIFAHYCLLVLLLISRHNSQRLICSERILIKRQKNECRVQKQAVIQECNNLRAST